MLLKMQLSFSRLNTKTRKEFEDAVGKVFRHVTNIFTSFYLKSIYLVLCVCVCVCVCIYTYYNIYNVYIYIIACILLVSGFIM